MIYTDISEEIPQNLDESILQAAANQTFVHQDVAPGTSLTIVIRDDFYLQSLNNQFREMDKPTDVLSFPADINDPDGDEQYIGDIVISYQRAEAQAQAGGHSTEAELQLLTVHGTLHLLGFTHSSSEGKHEMWKVQSEILDELGIGHIRIPE